MLFKWIGLVSKTECGLIHFYERNWNLDLSYGVHYPNRCFFSKEDVLFPVVYVSPEFSVDVTVLEIQGDLSQLTRKYEPFVCFHTTGT